MKWFPAPLRPGVELTVAAMLDEPMLRAFGFFAPPPGARAAVELAMRLRSRAMRRLPSRGSRFEDKQHTRTYPDGYRVEDLGPPGT